MLRTRMGEGDGGVGRVDTVQLCSQRYQKCSVKRLGVTKGSCGQARRNGGFMSRLLDPSDAMQPLIVILAEHMGSQPRTAGQRFERSIELQNNDTAGPSTSLSLSPSLSLFTGVRAAPLR